jgi:hypothetical protein
MTMKRRSHPATPGWSKSAGPSTEREFVKDLREGARRAAAKWLGLTPGRLVSDGYLASEVAKRLDHKNPVGTSVDYLMRCERAGLFRA